MSHDIRQIGLVGMGLVGAGWAAYYASRGIRVQLYDVNADALASSLARASRFLKCMFGGGLLAGADLEERLALLVATDDLADAVTDVDLVHESGPERYEIKAAIFRSLDELASQDTVLVSSSSGLLMSHVQCAMKYPERSLIAHPFNPVHLIPLVELVGGERTDTDVLIRMRDFFRDVGKEPVVLNTEVPGYIANRLQAAVWREAIELARRGVASVDDIDRALWAGPGIRWAFMGQNLIYHLGGGEGGIRIFHRSHRRPKTPTVGRHGRLDNPSG